MALDFGIRRHSTHRATLYYTKTTIIISCICIAPFKIPKALNNTLQ